MVRKSLGLYIIGAIAAMISVFLIITMSLSLTGNLKFLKHEYNVTFKNYDESVLYVDVVERGENANYEGKTPEREADGEFYYVFIGWDHSLKNVQESFTTYALYSTVTNQGNGQGTSTGDNENGGSQGVDPDNGGTEQNGSGEDSVGGGGDGDSMGDGDMGAGGGGGGGEATSNPESDNFQIKTPYNQNIYLRVYSYGTAYHPDENKWDAPEAMFDMDPELTNPLFYTASKVVKVPELKALSDIISLHYTQSDVPVPIPQYPFNFVSTKGMKYVNDRYVDTLSGFEQEYVFSSFLYSQEYEALLQAVTYSSNLINEEKNYRNYVKDNYLSFDRYFYTQLAEISSLYGLSSKSHGDAIDSIVQIVKNLGKVNPYFVHLDTDTDLGDPISNLFIDGIARPETYANIATFLLRDCGIPSRTVKGYRKCTNGVDEFVNVLSSDIYYWTEFYIDGIGWLNIDPIPTVYTSEGNPPSHQGHSSGGEGEGEGEGAEFDGGQVGDANEGQGADFDVMDVTISKKGIYYLRERSFVTYEDGRWDNVGYTPFEPVTLNPIYYTSDKLHSSDAEVSRVDINYLTELDYYPTPQYDAIYNVRYRDDTCLYTEPVDMKYSTAAYQDLSYDDALNNLSSLPRESVSETEANLYSQFVNENYLEVPANLEAAIQTFLEEHSLSIGDEDLINKVSEILRDSGEYIYARNSNTNDDVIINFLNNEKKGQCSLFASASTFIYRELGFPTRYVCGWLADAREENSINITSKEYHAWCEVYLDSVGWIAIDNTATISQQGSGSEHGGGGEQGGGENDPSTSRTRLDFTMEDKEFVYRGSSITLEELNISPNYSPLFDEDYIISYRLAKEYKNVGSYNVILRLSVIERSTNKDVSREFFASLQGKVKITPKPLTITTYSASKEYDGDKLQCSDYEVSGLISGHVLTLSITTSITEIGSIVNEVDKDSITIIDELGFSVKNNYKILYNYGILTVF